VTSYLRPRTLEEALDALGTAPRVIVAGTTDHFPSRVGTAPSEDVLDISGIEDLGRIAQTDAGWNIPALATWSDVIEEQLPPLFDGLKEAGRTIGGQQIQNRATVCGNVCNASPAADGVPILIALDAEVELASAAGTRRLPVETFLTGNRTTQRHVDELVTAIHVPTRGPRAKSAFIKLGARSSLVISIVMVAGVMDVNADGSIQAAGIAVGACSPVARRLRSLELRMQGGRPDPELANEVTPADLQPLSPIDDVRGTAAYRRDAALALVRRVIEGLTT
jgi:CO/xanthine dehydrogenase FAD-binding subunit